MFIFVLCLVFIIHPVSLNCPFLIAPSVFSNVYMTKLYDEWKPLSIFIFQGIFISFIYHFCISLQKLSDIPWFPLKHTWIVKSIYREKRLSRRRRGGRCSRWIRATVRRGRRKEGRKSRRFVFLLPFKYIARKLYMFK